MNRQACRARTLRRTFACADGFLRVGFTGFGSIFCFRFWGLRVLGSELLRFKGFRLRALEVLRYSVSGFAGCSRPAAPSHRSNIRGFLEDCRYVIARISRKYPCQTHDHLVRILRSITVRPMTMFESFWRTTLA